MTIATFNFLCKTSPDQRFYSLEYSGNFCESDVNKIMQLTELWPRRPFPFFGCRLFIIYFIFIFFRLDWYLGEVKHYERMFFVFWCRVWRLRSYFSHEVSCAPEKSRTQLYKPPQTTIVQALFSDVPLAMYTGQVS